MNKQIELVDGKYRVTLEYIGEGWNGDFDEEDADDQRLLRFSCFETVEGESIEIDDASYCTRLPVGTSDSILQRALQTLMRELKNARDGGDSIRGTMKRLSWLCPEDFSEKAVAV